MKLPLWSWQGGCVNAKAIFAQNGALDCEDKRSLNFFAWKFLPFSLPAKQFISFSYVRRNRHRHSLFTGTCRFQHRFCCVWPIQDIIDFTKPVPCGLHWIQKKLITQVLSEVLSSTANVVQPVADVFLVLVRTFTSAQLGLFIRAINRLARGYCWFVWRVLRTWEISLLATHEKPRRNEADFWIVLLTGAFRISSLWPRCGQSLVNCSHEQWSQVAGDLRLQRTWRSFENERVLVRGGPLFNSDTWPTTWLPGRRNIYFC